MKKRFDVTYLSESTERIGAYSIEAAAKYAHEHAFRNALKVMSVVEVPPLEPPAPPFSTPAA